MLRYLFIVILVLQSGSRLDCPTEASPLQSILFPILFFQLLGIYSRWVIYSHSVWLAYLGVSCQKVLYTVRESASRPSTDRWIRPPYFSPPETGRSSCTSRHWVSIFVASYDAHGLRWGRSFPGHHPGNGIHY